VIGRISKLGGPWKTSTDTHTIVSVGSYESYKSISHPLISRAFKLYAFCVFWLLDLVAHQAKWNDDDNDENNITISDDDDDDR